ncbi:molybdenum ABC transporter ATP-binding protein [Tropicimonas isoalkanivorans]|uniref:Molybdate transport system ATP-binding protein n=1 Tax=Tropicimonas isoalkanivorans TaxID=441112 RepID=A0A1I1PD39_9RHOB|nr:molybdenum ABC transporter ATP-binding protein [Tropicimonas isoalkanivorans]SFD07512.1 molybdate transport system ATP-binding protein [Tropicimonas isoalkanivorans]
MTFSVRLRHHLSDFTLDAAFEAPDGVTALLGHSGAGKTTVVQAVAGLLRPDEGRVAVGGWVMGDTAAGVWLPPHRRGVGYVFQEGRLFPHMTVRRNLAYGCRAQGRGVEEAEFDRIVHLLGIAGLLDRRPAGLSGGEKQRVAIGRALLSRPRLLLLDEPLAALDEARKQEILPFIEALRDEAGLPILYVSHAVAEVARLATTVVVLERGRVLRSGPTASVLSDLEIVPSFGPRSAGAVIEARVVAHLADGLSELRTSAGALLLPGIAAPPGRLLRIRILAHEVILSRARPEGLSALNILPATVSGLRTVPGDCVMVQLASGDDTLLARITTRSARALALTPGTPCHAIVKSVAVAPQALGDG